MSIEPHELVAICRAYEQIIREVETRASFETGRGQRERNLIAAFRMLGRERGFNEDDARAAWKAAGYGGL